MVLLQNDGAAAATRQEAKVRRIAIVGHLADQDNTGDHGSSNVIPPTTLPVLKGLRDYLGSGMR